MDHALEMDFVSLLPIARVTLVGQDQIAVLQYVRMPPASTGNARLLINVRVSIIGQV